MRKSHASTHAPAARAAGLRGRGAAFEHDQSGAGAARHAGRAQPPDPRSRAMARPVALRTAGARDRADRRRQADLSGRADRFCADPRGARGPRRGDGSAHPRREHVARPDGEMARSAPLPLQRGPSRRRRADFLLAQQCEFRERRGRSRRAQHADRAGFRSGTGGREADRYFIHSRLQPRLDPEARTGAECARSCPTAFDPRRDAVGAQCEPGMERVVQGRGRRWSRPAARASFQQRRPRPRCSRRRRRCPADARSSCL